MSSNSKMLNYINLLLHDDSELRKFVVDPITNSEEHGLTKAERAVLRRAVSGLSNNSKNGYSIDRSLSSYRRSLRMVQNVMHNVSSKVAQDNLVAATGQYPFSLILNYPNVPAGDNDFTGKTNQDVDADSGPYAHSITLQPVQLGNANPSIKDVMDEYVRMGLLDYTTVPNNGEEYVLGFTIGSSYIHANLATYALTDDYVFWFYTVNGQPFKGASTAYEDSISGSVGQSFAEHQINPGDVIHWQLIAPDREYGFQPCDPHPMNAFAKQKS